MIDFFLILLSTWNTSGEMGLNISQNYYNEAWLGSEVSSINWLYLLSINTSRNIYGKLAFSNGLIANYGQTYLQNSETGKWEPPKKSTDRIENEAILRFNMGGLVDPFSSLRFESQFYDNTFESVPRYLHPITLSESMGASKFLYKKDNNEILTRLGFTVKEFFERPVDTLTMTIAGSEIRIDGGLEWVTSSIHSFSENVLYKGELRVYKAFFNSKAAELEGTSEEALWKNPDIDFKNILSVSVIKYIKVNFYLQLIYERELDSRIMIKENLLLGLNVNLF